MKVKIFQDSVVFVSGITAEQFAKAKKFIPEKLTLTEGEGKAKKAVCSMGYADFGGINSNGIVFDATTDEGLLCHTAILCEGNDPHLTAEDKRQVIAEKHAGLILRMNTLEAQVLSALEENDDRITAATEAIETISLG